MYVLVMFVFGFFNLFKGMCNARVTPVTDSGLWFGGEVTLSV